MQRVFNSSQLSHPALFLQLQSTLHLQSTLSDFYLDTWIEGFLKQSDSQKPYLHFIMKLSFFVLSFTLGVAFGTEDEPKIGDYHAPGRADRMFHKRAPRDLGTFSVDCKNAESACNNACFYIRCLVRSSQFYNDTTTFLLTDPSE
jgi:hypothetical protein